MLNPEMIRQTYGNRLAGFIRISQTAGARPDYVQGGGGNTSCKLDDRLMVIKASGYRLNQIAEDQAYAVLDYAMLRHFYSQADLRLRADLEQDGQAQARAATLQIDGLAPVRPSVEAGFHALLDTFVLHTHSVYANLAACAAEGRDIVRQALSGLPAGFAWVPYINPGAQLTCAVGAARQTAANQTGRAPDVIFLQNHGLIVTGESADACLARHDQVNRLIASHFQVDRRNWPHIKLLALEGSVGKSVPTNFWTSATPWLASRLRKSAWDLDFFTRQSLYPDQCVFLSGQVDVVEKGSLSAALAGLADPNALTGPNPFPVKCNLFRSTGEVLYHCSPEEARTIEETLCAVFFITENIRKSGYSVKTMDEAGKDFIAGWESEQYRKSIMTRT